MCRIRGEDKYFVVISDLSHYNSYIDRRAGDKRDIRFVLEPLGLPVFRRQSNFLSAAQSSSTKILELDWAAISR